MDTKGIAIVALVGSAIVLAGCSLFGGPAEGYRHYSSVRQAALDALHESQGMGDNVMLRAIPSLSSAAEFRIGSVFVGDTYPLRYTKACEFDSSGIGEPAKLSPIPSYTGGNAFNVNLGLPPLLDEALPQLGSLGVGWSRTSELSFEYVAGTVESAPSVRELEKRLKSYACLKDIVNQDVLVVFQMFNMKEKYRSRIAIEDGSVGLTSKQLGDVELAFQGDRLVEVKDAKFQRRAWALMPYRLELDLDDDSDLAIALENALAEEAGAEIRVTRPRTFENTPSEAVFGL